MFSLKRRSLTLVIIAFVVGILTFYIKDATTTEVVESCKVIRLIDQPQYSKHGTSQRYIVVTDKETFIVESAILQGKFDNSNIFYNLKEGRTYTFKVAGIGKGFLTDYRNILKSLETSNK